MNDRTHIIILIATIWFLLLVTIIIIHFLAIDVNILAIVSIMGIVTAMVLSVAIGRKFHHRFKITKDREVDSELNTTP